MPVKIDWERVREILISLTLNFLLSLFIFLILVTPINTLACNREVRYFLEVIHRNQQESLLSVEVYPEEYFYLEFTNSRDLNPVIDVFRVEKDGDFCLVEERFPWYGVGQEYHPSRNMSYDEGWVVVKVNQLLPKLSLRIAYTVEQVLKVRNQEYLLNDLAESGTPIEIVIRMKGGQKKK